MTTVAEKKLVVELECALDYANAVLEQATENFDAYKVNTMTVVKNYIERALVFYLAR